MDRGPGTPQWPAVKTSFTPACWWTSSDQGVLLGLTGLFTLASSGCTVAFAVFLPPECLRPATGAAGCNWPGLPSARPAAHPSHALPLPLLDGLHCTSDSSWLRLRRLDCGLWISSTVALLLCNSGRSVRPSASWCQFGQMSPCVYHCARALSHGIAWFSWPSAAQAPSICVSSSSRMQRIGLRGMSSPRRRQNSHFMCRRRQRKGRDDTGGWPDRFQMDAWRHFVTLWSSFSILFNWTSRLLLGMWNGREVLSTAFSNGSDPKHVLPVHFPGQTRLTGW